MFNQVGKKIQKISAIVFGVQAIVSCILGLVLWGIITGEEPDIKAFLLGLLVGAVVAAAGILSAWLNQLLLQAYGKIAEHCEAQLVKEKEN